MSYEYESPTENSWEKVEIPKELQEDISVRIELDWRDKYEFYVKNGHLKWHRLNSLWSKIAVTLCLPVLLFLSLIDVKTTIKEWWEFLNEKKYGAFTSDHCKIEQLDDELKQYLKEGC